MSSTILANRFKMNCFRRTLLGPYRTHLALAGIAACLTGCAIGSQAGPKVIPLNPVPNLPLNVSPLPLHIGAYYSAELRTYKYVAAHFGGAWENPEPDPRCQHVIRYAGAGYNCWGPNIEIEPRNISTGTVWPVGAASIRLFDQVFALMFESARLVPSLPPLPADGPAVAGVLEPAVKDVGMFCDTRGRGGRGVEITYRFILYSPQGSRIASWDITGAAEVRVRDASAMQRDEAMELAMRDAALKLLAVFRGIPEVRGWIRQIGADRSL